MTSRSLDRVRKRKNEDEEVMFVILPALHLYLSTLQRKKEPRHLSFLYGKERVRELLGGHLKNCLTAFRMEPHIFMWLASYLRNEGLISDSRIKVEEKLAFFLYMLSHNASYEKLQIEFQHCGWSFSKYIREFFDIVPTLSTRFLKPLNDDEAHPKITMMLRGLIMCHSLSHMMLVCLLQKQRRFRRCPGLSFLKITRNKRSNLRNSLI